MLVDFNTLPLHSRVWIYPSDRRFSEKERQEIYERLTAFLSQWQAHGEDLKASFETKYDWFIIIAADQDYCSPSGCSIDAQVHLIQEFEKDFGISLLDKMNVSFRQGAYITYKSAKDFKNMVKKGAVSSKTIVYNNVVNNIEEYQNYWEVPALESWHQRFFKK